MTETNRRRSVVRHDENVQNQQHREEKTVVIATGLSLFCLVLVVGGFALWVANSLFNLGDSTTTPLLSGLTITAGVVLVAYLVRAGQR